MATPIYLGDLLSIFSVKLKNGFANAINEKEINSPLRTEYNVECAFRFAAPKI